MQLNFRILQESDYLLLLKWLQNPHVKEWWDRDIEWTLDLVKEKYGSDKRKEIASYLILIDEKPIGYIQLYNAYNFPRNPPIKNLYESLGAFDMLIGEEKYLDQGIGSAALAKFLQVFASNYQYIFAAPNKNNIVAVRCYKKIGFKKIQEHSQEIWMIKMLTPGGK